MQPVTAASPTPATPRDLGGLILLWLLVALLSSLPPAAAASGSASVTIRVEVGAVDLLRGGGSTSLGTDLESERLLAAYAPRLRRALEGRYTPDEADRIVREVAGHAVVVIGDDVVGRGFRDAALVELGDGSVCSL